MRIPNKRSLDPTRNHPCRYLKSIEHIVTDTEHAKDAARGKDGEHSKQVVTGQVISLRNGKAVCGG